jgi:hypothetical protein
MRVFVVLAFITLTASVHAWELESKVDSMTDEARSMATIRNGEGHSFSVYRQKDGTVWALFSLSSKSAQTLSPKTMPIIRVDKYPPNDFMHDADLQALLARLRGTTPTPTYFWEPKWVHAKLWHGDDAESRATIVDQLGQGKTLLVRYYLFTGGYKETSFAIGASAPFYRALTLVSMPARASVDVAQ